MDANDDDDLTDAAAMLDESMAVVTAYRERAAAKLDQIARQTKQTLAEAGIDIDVFFLIPSSGDSVIVFGTAADPSDELWSEVSAIVSSIVRQEVGLDRVRCRPVTCADTNSITDQPSQPTVKPTGQSGCCSVPIHAPGAEV